MSRAPAALLTEAPPKQRSAAGPALAVGAAVLVAVSTAVAILLVEGRRAAPVALMDPGALVRYGLPAARVGHDLAAALTVGLLVLAAWCVAPEPGSARRVLSGSRRLLARAAAVSATVWVVTGSVTLVLVAAEVSGIPPGTEGSSQVMAAFVSQLDLGRALAASLLLAMVVATLASLATRVPTLAWAAVISLTALLPLALSGHAAGSGDHVNSVNSLALHLLGATVWVGGLAALVLYGRRLGDQLATVAGRYSTLAGWCFVLVAVSGVVNAALRLGSWSALGTSYGLLVVAKTVALCLLGIAGLAHRRLTLRRLAAAPALFARLAVVELLVMGAAMGLAVALSRSVPPAPATAAGSVATLLGYPEPPPLTLTRYFTEYHLEILWLTVALVLAGAYIAGVRRLQRRGDRWPVQRVLLWLAGCGALVLVTSGGLAVYGRIHFSAHMLQHMTLMVVVPLLLVLGAPVTLAMRALRAREDGSFGPREMLLALVHAPVLKVLGHPAVAAVLFVIGLPVFYYSSLFELAMFTHTGHVLMTAHFLLAGYLFIWALVGIDPGPSRPSYPFRLLLLLLTVVFHAFFGISMMSSSTLLAPEWFHALGQTDDVALLADQQKGGAIAWALGDIPSFLLGLALLVGWVRSDAKERRRVDRQADRDGDAELRRYNEQLAAMARRDGPG